MKIKGPKRIICLTEEPTEILYLIGEQHRIVGISRYTVRPEEAKKNHPIVSAFVDGSVKKISELKPDLVIGFSDIQGDLAAKLIKANLQVLIFNQRSIEEILEVILTIGRIVSAEDKAQKLVDGYKKRLNLLREKSGKIQNKPRVYFEEWDDPTFSGIRWVSELIEIAGGEDIFANKSHGKLAMEREIQWSDVIEKTPDVILASWCGKPVDIDSIKKREGWNEITAIKNDRIHEIDSSIILQPGPACLTDGLKVIESLIREHNIKFCVGLNRRFSKEYVSLKKKTKGKKIKIIQIISRSANHNVNLSVRNGGLFYDKGFHFFDLACWWGNSLPKKMIVISKSISTEEFLKKGDFSDAVINMRLRNNINVELVFSRKCRLGNIEKIKIFGEKFILNSDDYSNKKTLSKDFAIRHKDSYFKCLNNFINSKKSLLFEEGINVQNICEQALKLAK